jgi:hypothetical protein
LLLLRSHPAWREEFIPSSRKEKRQLGTASHPYGVRLFIGILYNPAAPIETILQMLDDRFGERQYSHGPIPFAWTEYYSKEMGTSLTKLYYNYQNTIDRAILPEIKIFSNELEQKFVDALGNRQVNIDPGYISRDKVVLATTKDFYHRLYLADGIFGEVTLHYRRGRFRYFSWTYPDYRDPAVMQFLERVRAPLVKELRDRHSPEGGI